MNMSTFDILRKPHVNETEMIHVVQDYILARKGVTVEITLDPISWSAQRETLLLHAAFNSACEWFAHNPSKVPHG